MNHLKALGMKYVLVSVALLMVLGVFNYRISVILLFSAVVTAVAYFVGDLFILRKFGNAAATIADFGIAFASIWLFNSFYIDHVPHVLLVSLLTGVLIAIGEAFFHAYLDVKFYGKGEPYTNEITRGDFQRYATEFGEEKNIIRINKKSTEK